MKSPCYKNKYYQRLRDGKKIPRKVKKQILGLRVSKAKLRRKIKEFQNK